MNFEKIKQAKYDQDSLLNERKGWEEKLKPANDKYETICKIQAMLQETTNEIQNRVKFSISSINQKALNMTFPGYKFIMDFTIKNNVSHAGIKVQRKGRALNPYDSNGGGLGNIIAMCSQMAAQKMSLTRGVILADQPMRDVSAGKEEMAMDMIKTLSKELGIQYIMISHIDSQINSADNTITVELVEDEETGFPISKVTHK